MKKKTRALFFSPTILWHHSWQSWQCGIICQMPTHCVYGERFVRKVRFNRLINYLIKIMRELAAETLIECQTSNQSRMGVTNTQRFRHCNRSAFHFYFICLDLDKSQHILFHLLSALIFFPFSFFCFDSARAPRIHPAAHRLPNTVSHNFLVRRLFCRIRARKPLNLMCTYL